MVNELEGPIDDSEKSLFGPHLNGSQDKIGEEGLFVTTKMWS